MIRFAGFRQPIVPDRTAFGATVQQKAQGDYAENQCQSPEHRPPLLLARLYFPKSGIFKPSLFKTKPFQAGIFKNWGLRLHSAQGAISGGNQHSCQDIAEARRVLGDVFAPWVQDLGLSVEQIECAASAGSADDWQPGATLRMAFSERLCRHGGIVCGQALMALADTSMVIAILAANRGYRPMTTVDQTTHFMRAVTASDVLADAQVVRLGRTMSFGRVTLLNATDNKPVAMVSSAFAML